MVYIKVPGDEAGAEHQDSLGGRCLWAPGCSIQGQRAHVDPQTPLPELWGQCKLHTPQITVGLHTGSFSYGRESMYVSFRNWVLISGEYTGILLCMSATLGFE